jgi:putative endonuclease
MYFVYILYSEKDNDLYVGCTSDIKERLKRHNSGQVLATKYRKPFVCIHLETFNSKDEAFNRERFLKTLWSARFKNKIKKTYLKNKQSE